MDMSIIVPFKNGRIYIDRFMNGYLKQANNQDVEIELLFVSNLSTDKTTVLINDYISRYNLDNIRILEYNDKPSSYAARNYGVKKAQGKLLVFTDIDCLMSESFLAEIWNCYMQGKGVAMGGRIIIEIEDYDNYWELYDAFFNMDNEKMLLRNRIATADFAIEKRLFDEVGEFAELISSGDSEFGERLHKAGIKVLYNENAIVYHPSRRTYAEIEKKLLRIGYGEGQRAKLDGANIHKMMVLYLLKAFNVIHLKRIWGRMKNHISFHIFIKFAKEFTKIRLGQARAFRNGFNGEKLNTFNK